MATTAVPAMVIASTVVPSTSMRSSFSGAAVQGLPALKMNLAARPLTVTASTKKIKVAQPLGPSGDFKSKKGVDAGGRVLKGKGVYQFVDKYGANVDGYSPIYAKEEWSKSGDSYAGGTPALAIWALLLGGLLVGGALLVYNTSALSG
ncbi:photosystem II 10 kDa polypeptide, chloroplastic [Physcomitrium patens]|uniref:Photosystem II 10 kDa polypeptide, chloroplastic n=1 Tax=Physcomitrium patens TaxID=3218 RepID=A9S7M9_PHYPA|nr:photosystem II 10 kDa polypeptide, chloroplastic-like [Physcomitrium patens]PNR26226.1 hypothetical protein PHYPA_030800 [Physcomitrium patens]|eukprot:XP_024367742.1 photosystem II 10 kDa polypeptide, chloroplastic-like [Physcomitrella patens]